MSKAEIKLIAVDLDGTLLNSAHQIGERSEKALKAAIEKGVQVVIATGKSVRGGKGVVEQLKLKTPGVYGQGTTVYRGDGTLLTETTIDRMLVRQIVTFAEDRGFQVALYNRDRILVREDSLRLRQLTVDYHEPAPERVGPLQNVLDNVSIHKILITKPGDGRAVSALRWQLSMQIQNRASLLQVGIVDLLEILPPGVSKGSGLKQLIKEMGVPASAVLAIGDAENDVEMLQLAGTSVAMGNASDHVKSVAKHVVASNDADGVAEAVERFVLNVEAPPVLSQAISESKAAD